MSERMILQTHNLSKKFGDNFSVKDLSIHVKEGEIYGFLGPNGAGKSTTMKMILGLIKATEGSIDIFDKTLQKNQQDILKHIGSLIEEPSYYPNMTGLENLQLVQQLMKLPSANVKEALKIVRLTEHKDKLVKNYSLGMKQRLGIALAIVKFPKFLILDEPTNGLDPAGIQEIRQLIKSFPEKYGMTVLISSHLLSEIEQIATTVGIINHGQLIFEGDLKQLEDDEKIEIQTNQFEKAITLLKKNDYSLDETMKKICLLSSCSKFQIAKAIKLLVDNDIEIYQVRSVKKSLEQTFLEMTNHGKELL